MTTPLLTSNPSSVRSPLSKPAHLFVFLEIFSCEGGIQSYVKDVLRAYEQAAAASSNPQAAEVFLLRDGVSCENPFDHLNNPYLQFRYFKSNSPWWGRLTFMGVLLGRLLRQRPASVICGHVKLAPLIRLLCKPLGIPYRVMTYGKEVWQPLPGSARQALQDAQELWTISRHSRDRACESNHLDPEQFKLLPCVVNGDIFSPGPKPAYLLERYHLQDARVLMTVARLWSGDIYKGVDVTLRALPKILHHHPDVKYLIIGRGDDRPRLEQLAQELGVSEQVVFAGFVPTEELPDHYRVADAYVMPSQEGFGIVYLEAMASGIPVLSGQGDGSADPLQDGKLGWQVAHRDPEAVAQACIEMLEGKDARVDGPWLRRETLAQFGEGAIAQRLQRLMGFQ